ncbi:thrombospondin type 3 repeat-containing protein, partial [bacterium]|nr:thrombospondin type 3 repeat-containing protein [bacterium]
SLSSLNAWNQLLSPIGGKPQFWNMHNMTTPMPYSVNPNLTGNGAGNANDQISAIQNAADTWNNQGNANFQFQYQGQTNIINLANDGVNIIAGRTDCVLALGQCLCASTTNGKVSAFSDQTQVLNTGEILEKDIILCDNNFNFFASANSNATPGSFELDAWGLLVHELGHNLGLGHPFDATPSQNVCSVMQQGWFSQQNCGWNWNETNKRNLASDDIVGIQGIYGVFDPGFLDDDGDGVPNNADNCQAASNPNQLDTDGDGSGDACDNDDDNDGLTDEEEAAIGSDPTSTDTDEDGLNDYEEHSVYGTNPTAKDSDGDGIDDLKEIELGLNPIMPDNPAVTIIINYLLDDDSDGDGIDDASDNCPNNPNSDQYDFDNDGLGNECDDDLCNTNADCTANQDCLSHKKCFNKCQTKDDCPETMYFGCLGGYGQSNLGYGYCVTEEEAENFFKGILNNVLNPN